MGRPVDAAARERVDAVLRAAFPQGGDWVPATAMQQRLALVGATDWQRRRACARWEIMHRRVGGCGPWLWLPRREVELTSTLPDGCLLVTERRGTETGEQHAARHRETVRALARRPARRIPTSLRSAMEVAA